MHTIQFSKGTWHQIEIRESAPHECSPAPKFEERSHEETLHQGLQSSVGFGENIYKRKNSDNTSFCTPNEWTNKEMLVAPAHVVGPPVSGRVGPKE